MKRRYTKHTFVVGQEVHNKDRHEGVILAIWDDILKINFISGPRVGMHPLVDHCSYYHAGLAQ